MCSMSCQNVMHFGKRVVEAQCIGGMLRKCQNKTLTKFAFQRCIDCMNRHGDWMFILYIYRVIH